MTDRIPLDSLNSDQLDALYDERDRLRAAWRSARHRARVLSDEVTRRAPLLGEYAAEMARLRATLDDVLRHFVHKGHPGLPCLSSGWVDETTVARWRATLWRAALHAPKQG
jgi:hypothetical protein